MPIATLTLTLAAALINVSQVMPIAREFAPEFVFISAGFDAAYGDPLGGMALSPAGYAYMTEQLCSLAQVGVGVGVG